MFGEPEIRWTRFSIGRALHRAVEWTPIPTGSIALPPMRFVEIHFVVKCVVNRNIRPGDPIDPRHNLLKMRSMSAVPLSNPQHKAVRMDHFVQQRFHQILPRPQLQQRLAQPDDATPPEPITPLIAYPGAAVHPLAPLELHTLQFTLEELPVENWKQPVNVRRRINDLPIRMDQVLGAVQVVRAAHGDDGGIA